LKAIYENLVETSRRRRRKRRRRASICIPCKKRERKILEEECWTIKKEEGSFRDSMLHL
jgi:hypothetical protein